MGSSWVVPGRTLPVVHRKGIYSIMHKNYLYAIEILQKIILSAAAKNIIAQPKQISAGIGG